MPQTPPETPPAPHRPKPSSFRNNEKGNIAMFFGMMIIPLMLTVGFAVDFLRLTNYRAKAAEILDVSLLMTTQQYAYDKTIDVTATAQANIHAHWNSSEPEPQVTAQVQPNNNISGTIVNTLPTTFMAVAGINTMNINVTSEVTANTKNLELVLVLDNTGSMNTNDKIGTLRTAATDLVTSVMPVDPTVTLSNVKVSIVPFSQYVNVGTDKAGENWLTVPADSQGSWNELTDPASCAIPGTPGTSSTCTDDEGNSYSCMTGGTSPSGCPASAYTTHNYTTTWEGCVGSRNNPENMTDSNYGNKVPGILTWGNQCPSKMTALTDNQSTITTAISNMSGSNIGGLTYIPHGLMWGWRALSEQKPFDQGVPYTDTKVTKVMVLMTDGNNTVYPTFPNHNSIKNPAGNIVASKKAVADDYTGIACTNIKAKGIKIYTIAFEVTDAATKTLLQNCATETANYFDATDAASLKDAFRDITLELINLRVAK